MSLKIFQIEICIPFIYLARIKFPGNWMICALFGLRTFHKTAQNHFYKIRSPYQITTRLQQTMISIIYLFFLMITASMAISSTTRDPIPVHTYTQEDLKDLMPVINVKRNFFFMDLEQNPLFQFFSIFSEK